MNTKNRLIAGGVFLALVVGLVLVLRFVDLSPEEEVIDDTAIELPDMLFPDAQFETVTAFSVTDNTSGDRVTVRQLEEASAEGDEAAAEDLFATSGASWEVLETPIESESGLVDDERINSAVANLPLLMPTRSLSEVEALTTYGLGEDPLYTLTFETASGPHTIEVGNQAATSTAYYVQVPGDAQVHLIQTYQIDPLLAMLTSPPFLDDLLEEFAPTAEGDE